MHSNRIGVFCRRSLMKNAASVKPEQDANGNGNGDGARGSSGPREWKLPMRLVLIKSMTLFCNASAIDMHASESSAVSFHAVGRLPVVLLPVRHTQHLFLPCYGAESAARPYQWSSETISSRAPDAVVAVKTGGMQNSLSTIAQRTSMQTPVYNLHQRLPIWSLDKQVFLSWVNVKVMFCLSAVGCIWPWFVWH